MAHSETIRFSGEVLAVKGRIRLIRSFDLVSHQYQGTLVLRDDEEPETLRRIAIGPGAHTKHQFRIGDRVSGTAHRVPDPETEWAEVYRVSGLRLEQRGPETQQRPPDPEGGIAAPLEVYRANRHRRLDVKTRAGQFARCPWGLTMATEIILDQWNPSKRK